MTGRSGLRVTEELPDSNPVSSPHAFFRPDGVKALRKSVPVAPNPAAVVKGIPCDVPDRVIAVDLLAQPAPEGQAAHAAPPSKAWAFDRGRYSTPMYLKESGDTDSGWRPSVQQTAS